MDKNIVTEIVSFEIHEAVSPENFIQIAHTLETAFHMHQPGYIDSELVKGPANSWTMIMHWASLHEVRTASKLMMKSPLTEKFRQAIIPATVKMGYLEQVGKWSGVRGAGCEV